MTDERGVKVWLYMTAKVTGPDPDPSDVLVLSPSSEIKVCGNATPGEVAAAVKGFIELIDKTVCLVDPDDSVGDDV